MEPCMWRLPALCVCVRGTRILWDERLPGDAPAPWPSFLMARFRAYALRRVSGRRYLFACITLVTRPEDAMVVGRLSGLGPPDRAPSRAPRPRWEIRPRLSRSLYVRIPYGPLPGAAA